MSELKINHLNTTKTISQVQDEMEVVFHRQFRFNVFSEKSPGMETWVVSADYSLRPQKFTVKYYDISSVTRIYINQALEQDFTDHFTVLDYDGLGNKIGTADFHNCKLVEHHTLYGYDTKAVIHRLTFDFTDAKIS